MATGGDAGDRDAGDSKPGPGGLVRRMFGIGFVEREGTLVLERFSLGERRSPLEADFHGLGTIDSWYRVRFAEAPEVLQGRVHGSRILNRVKAGERVAIQVDPRDGYVRKVRPLERRLRWWQA